MTVYIISTLHRGKKLPVLLKPVDGKLQVIDINGYDPRAFPKSVGQSALKKITPKEIPVLNHPRRIGPDFNLKNFDTHEFDLSDLTL